MATRCLQISRYVHIGSHGGTERYLLDLVRELANMGSESSIAWLTVDQKPDAPFMDSSGITIFPFTVPAGYVDVPPAVLQEVFVKHMQDCSVDVMHFHTFGLSEAALAEVARTMDIPYVFTYHSPAWSCRRGDLLRWGTQICNGEVRPWHCSACMIQQRLQCPAPAAWALTGLLAPLGLLGRFIGGKLHRRTAFIEDTTRFRAALRTFLQHASKVVACAEWSIPVLELNGASRNRISHIPQGVPMDFVRAVAQIGDRTRNPAYFTVGYVGRVTPVKGVHILVEAFARTEYKGARLRVYGGGDARSGEPYLRQLKTLVGSDPRIEFIPQLPFEAMLEEYQKLDLLAIPSVWLETGPLTLLEALALGVEVWGSARIGQMEVLREHGRVIEPNTVAAWQMTLEEAFARHNREGQRRRHPVAVRTMQDVTQEMVEIYKTIKR
jgi:glycosyltransferase involved in cell wall biosynthesis